MADGEDQAEILGFIEQGGLGEPVARIDTHGAFVFLGRERAWKMKRAVRFGFMDLSTRDRREAAIRAELALNRRTAPELYRAVVVVARSAEGGLAPGGAGEPIEWLLEMNRFPAEAQLDRVAARGELTLELVERLAVAVADFHDHAEPRPAMGGVAAMREVVDGNAAELAGLAPAMLEPRDVAALNDATSTELDRRAGLLEARREGGKVRRCHGDLHLANVVLLDGRPVPFDCLEFSEELASIDLLYDVGFLVMDLIERRLRDQAWRLLQTYHDRRPDDAGLALVPLFVSVRAAIRAKIAGFTALTAERGADREGLVRQARAYLALARTAIEASPVALVAIGGRSGTGKSTLAAAVAPWIGPVPGATLLRSDVIRKQLFGCRPTDRLPERAYAPEVTLKVHAQMIDRAATLLRAGRSVICDAVHGEEAERRAVAEVADRARVPFHAFWLEAPEPVLEARVAARSGDASDADLVVLRRQRELVQDRAVDWPRLRTDRPLAASADEILAILKRERGQPDAAPA